MVNAVRISNWRRNRPSTAVDAMKSSNRMSNPTQVAVQLFAMYLSGNVIER